MKNLFSILVVLALATTLAFSQVNDNSGSVKTGTGSFQATVLTPLTIDSPETPVNLGEFVVSSTEYPLTDAITFNVSGEYNHPYFYSTTATNANPSTATFAGDWDATYSGTSGTKTLDGSGTSTHTYTLTGLTALVSGVATLNLSVTVSYNTF